MKIVNYLDDSLNLNNSNYKPYHKPDKEMLYIHKYSNHPPSILTSIQERIPTLSSNETIFSKSKEIYQKSLEKSGYRLFGLTLSLLLMSKQKSKTLSPTS